MRQTNFCLEKLKSELDNPKTGLPRCLIINKIALVFLEEEDEKAEVFLRDLLFSKSGDSEVDRFIAFCALSAVDSEKLEKRTRRQLENFKNASAHQDLLKMASSTIERYKETQKKTQKSVLEFEGSFVQSSN